MNRYKIYTKIKMRYYRDWYFSMTPIERGTDVGGWVLNNYVTFTNLVADIELQEMNYHSARIFGDQGQHYKLN